jgi:mRNA-degrading endonuclease RelE of RelBE toxin-antitoxin system
MPFVLEFTESAWGDLGFFRKYEQSIITEEIHVQLSYEPDRETRNRKAMEPNALADWELRIGDYRVFYDIDTAVTTVKVKAIGYKEHNRLFIRGKEYPL